GIGDRRSVACGERTDAPQRSGLEAGPDSETGVEQSRAGSTGGKRGSGQSPRAEQASASNLAGTSADQPADLLVSSRVTRSARMSELSNIQKARREYLKERCPNCGLQRLFPIENKYRCDNCEKAEDFFQDGDRVDSG